MGSGLDLHSFGNVYCHVKNILRDSAKDQPVTMGNPLNREMVAVSGH